MMGISASDQRNDALLTWYADHARTLPWRTARNPYTTMVSEFMLQQTQVSRVVPKYEAFMERWPTIEGLASAKPEQVLAMWSGLGYNSRALRLLATARTVAETGWPDTVDGLTALPGIGPYTARAIASIAFGEPVAAVDTNLRRILTRWHGNELHGRELDDLAARCLGTPSGDWNQAMMDLGSIICSPRKPLCETCPVDDYCVDPTAYRAPLKQSRFAGSNRELRGALVRAHVHGQDLEEAGQEIGRDLREIESTIAMLRSEGLLPTPDDGYPSLQVEEVR